ncbi:methyltransferase [Orrella marina]|uniref:Methyltransferase n=1 Tax=Orrella marina TaxID=2163011 RepID=A0A2R4XIP3_9BURK|nr:class I SAM-dependent methyltransferase [Orrella marina]AWB33665.1 methyltransferase [Orrella marina]
MTGRSSNPHSPLPITPVAWEAFAHERAIRWHSSSKWPHPKRLIEISSAIPSDQILRLLQQGTAILWRGDFHEGRQILQSVKRRLSNYMRRAIKLPMPQGFHQLRLARSQQARTLGLILIQIDPDWSLVNRRAPDIRAACEATLGDAAATHACLQTRSLSGEKHDTTDTPPVILPLSDLLGILSAYQWHLKGVEVAALGARIHPRHGVFAPTRQEYLELVAGTALPATCESAIDLGTGTGVIAAILAQKGVPSVLAIESHQPALQCARDNIDRLGLGDRVTVRKGDLLTGAPVVDLIVCNPPWLPGVARNPLEAAIHDPEHRMLRGFLAQAPTHLPPSGQAWLIISDLAELLGLRSRETLLQWISEAGLRVIDRVDTRATHPKAADQKDPLAPWRAREVTSLWRLSLA